MNAEFFIDTNLFIYQLEAQDSRKYSIAENIIREGVCTLNSCISFQVVQECLNTILRKNSIPLNPEEARFYLDSILIPLWRIMPSKELYYRGLDIQARYRYSFYDLLIIAAGVESGCRTLYSEDLQHGQRIERMTIVNPFKE